MKYLKYILVIVIFFAVNVYADEFNFLVDCNDNTVTIGDKISCDVAVISDGGKMSGVEFEYETSFSTSFIADSSFSISNSENRITVIPLTSIDSSIDAIRFLKIELQTNNNTEIGDNVIKFKNIIFKDSDGNIYNHDDKIKTINVVNKSSKEADCNLLSITVDGNLIRNFDPNVYRYENIYVQKRIIFIDAEKSGEKSSVMGLGNMVVRENMTVERVIHVVAENGDFKDYTLVITNGESPISQEETLPDEKDTDNSLKSLEIYNGKNRINFDFDSIKTMYNIIVTDEKINKVTVKAVLNSSKSSFVSNYGPRDINIKNGDNYFEIKVQAESEDIRTYKINISKEIIETKEESNLLKTLKVNDQDIMLDDSIFEYNITLNHDANMTKIEALAKNNDAKVDFKDISLVDGNNVVVIKVTTKSGLVKEYKLNINRLSEEEKAVELKNIIIKGYNIDFNPNKYEYELNIDKDIDKLDISIDPIDIEYKIYGNDNLIDNSKIAINVKSTNYTINIHKELNENKIIYYLIFGIGIISLILSIIYAIKKNKKALQ